MKSTAVAAFLTVTAVVGISAVQTVGTRADVKIIASTVPIVVDALPRLSAKKSMTERMMTVNKIMSKIFKKEVADKDISEDAVVKLLDRLHAVFIKKSSPKALSSLMWDAELLIMRQHLELERLQGKGGGAHATDPL